MAETAADKRLGGVANACIYWSDRVPIDADFGDVYFSTSDPIAESDHVFIQANDLSARWADWGWGRPFVVGEIGFGSGLNILRAAACFLSQAPCEARLHCVSVEARPLDVADAERLLDYAEVGGDCRAALLDQWPHAVAGVHRLVLHPRVTLDLHLGAVETALADMDACVDAWFLDGFAPARNPAMWQTSVLNAVADLSRPGTTLSSFTSAGWVRRGLMAAGFTCKRVPGFAGKRSMLTARLHTDAQPQPSRGRAAWTMRPEPIEKPRRVVVIGAGLAGTTAANALAARGLSVTVFDPAGVAGGASGNRQAATYIRLPAGLDVTGAFYLASLNYTLAWLRQLDPARHLWQDCGLLQIAASAREADRQKRVATGWALPETMLRCVDRVEAAALAGVELGSDVRGGLYYPAAGWVYSAELCGWLLARHGLEVQAERITNLVPSQNGWRVESDTGRSEIFDTVVVAAADKASSLCPDLPELELVRGQASEFAASEVRGEIAPRCVVCANSYVLPSDGARLTVGATYASNDPDANVRARDDAANVDGLAATTPLLARALGEAEPVSGRVGWRAAMPDSLPLVGGVPDRSQWLSAYAAYRHDAKTPLSAQPSHWPNLWVCAGHASRGVVSAPLAAEISASMICGEPMPVARSLVDAVNPGRSMIRALRRCEI
ncbi:bifunctional tRNA (5-methylaminomethyl-2-thiouridine)(34)-methyltransferase MnmD/FAD-dependent 5-carboxymethylaminomethyl-2-thiouridine(34) oxidoreductase MnmC [Salinisphaera sp. USBA-960]|uniref:bifunctional tRNA (5-methylaminomethyl-2-thiouridine)(34)-methyltransferase MnmD/FAD-dependent 5-carboxymethylaminomethyl-2-thiouridine(34) oxidoreductase MnmC n=1 Tax=Salinisphaera orenii TaxID=856731 RepID=UPI000DBE42EA|nr:bifunctional tRNA (5-methylaminomethyl-2-thiouridine)(34)-methyltransferase MnmD/FAD-dependent 5-carboxymethylaminomethyl-2-thiouridine(34) oxidoreductase MnmC [Salifodinibacter halophilus]NNC25738.1 bifunctional tRNA (5-methylaminomethyl-2-thiouridine)(34)-methyltransferase MnmD/FAD-dependent 5-carboxymethylaminomethyl-2-thiouridine(34) oxidoreductase MnmC [Salifodinibacter halophilus]